MACATSGDATSSSGDAAAFAVSSPEIDIVGSPALKFEACFRPRLRRDQGRRQWNSAPPRLRNRPRTCCLLDHMRKREEILFTERLADELKPERQSIVIAAR